MIGVRRLAPAGQLGVIRPRWLLALAAAALMTAAAIWVLRCMGNKEPPADGMRWAAYVDQGAADGCGGSIVKQGWILTAAHCVSSISGNDKLHVYVGLREIKGGRHRKVTKEKIHIHPDYKQNQYQHYDVALIEVDFTLDNDAVAIMLASEPDERANGEKAYAAGWGCLPNCLGDEWLVYREVKVTSFSTCPMGVNHICTTPDVLAPGDSGSGLTSAVSGCARLLGVAREKQPDDFMRVSQFATWINQVIHDQDIKQTGCRPS